ncbi:AraC family transcriptional regulator [Paenibacillus sp. MBLB4367]|uniref:AraC family transcriptional regulator n=1 Tax=Paenibacillus sp. MBLB4367 TaxID=3384767 RepID=UPI0039082F26
MSKYPMIDISLTQETFPFPIVIGRAVQRQTWIPPHHHQFYELSFYVQGSALDLVNGQMIRASRGTVICKLPHRIHESRVEKGQTYSKYTLMFDVDILLESEIDSGMRRFYYFVSDENRAPFFQLNEEHTAFMERLFREISDDYDSDRPFRQSFIRSKLIEILICIARSQSGSEAPESSAASAEPALYGNVKSNNTKISQVLQYINSHYLEDMSLGSLSQKFAVTTPYLSKMIKKITGMNYTEYVHELRIEMACSLLVSTRMSVLDVSGESGYGSFKTFSRVFLKKKGMTPLKYRNVNTPTPESRKNE